MFSYRHAYHAGNHADVLKHTVLIAILKHLCAKDTDVLAVDTHAGAGLYRLDSAPAQTSGESLEGLLALVARLVQRQRAPAPALRDYLDVLASFNAAIAEREAAGHKLDNRLIRIEDTTVHSAMLDGHVARIALRFVADIAAVTRDADGQLIAGSLDDAVESCDVWTFSRDVRSTSPAWMIDETDEG